MQDHPLFPSPSMSNLVYAGLAAILALVGKQFFRWAQATIQRIVLETMPASAAQAKKTNAEADQIKVQSNIEAAEAIGQVITQMLEGQRAMDALRVELTLSKQREVILTEQNARMRLALKDKDLTFPELPPAPVVKSDDCK